MLKILDFILKPNKNEFQNVHILKVDNKVFSLKAVASSTSPVWTEVRFREHKVS